MYDICQDILSQLPQRDSVATSSSGFIGSTRKAFKSGNSEIELPVKKWYLGCNYFDVPYILKFRRKASEFTIRTTGNSEIIRLEKDVSGTQVSSIHLEFFNVLTAVQVFREKGTTLCGANRHQP